MTIEPELGNGKLAHMAGAVGIAGQVAGAFPFLLIPLLTVPSPEMYLFFVAWVVLVVAAISWWRHHPWRSLLVPIISVPAVYLVLVLGERFLAWGP